MYWGQIAIAFAGACAAAYLLADSEPIGVVGLTAVLVFLSIRWLFAWVFRVRYWVSHVGYRGRPCPDCDLYIHRQRDDWILTCRRCGWKAGWPGLRWFTDSVPMIQLRRTIIGPSLVVFILASFLLLSGAGAQVTDVGFSEDDTPPDIGDADTPGDILVTSTPVGTPDQDRTRGEVSERTVERLILEVVNERRTERSPSSLEWNDRAAERAREHAEDMAENDYFNHTSLEGETQIERYRFCDGGENAMQTWVNRRIETDDGVEQYTTESELAEGIVTGWMNSEPHRERGIYGEWWSSAGAGVAITDDGKVYAVLGFCQ